MKKLYLLLLCFGLIACDNNTIVGKCLTNERSTTKTEQDGKITRIKITDGFICGCFENTESDLPQFGPSKEDFLFEITETTDNKGNVESTEYKYTAGTLTTVVSGLKSKAHAEKVCNKHCTNLCNQK